MPEEKPRWADISEESDEETMEYIPAAASVPAATEPDPQSAPSSCASRRACDTSAAAAAAATDDSCSTAASEEQGAQTLTYQTELPVLFNVPPSPQFYAHPSPESDDSRFTSGWTDQSDDMKSFELGMPQPAPPSTCPPAHEAGAQTLMYQTALPVAFYVPPSPQFYAQWEFWNTQGQEVWPHRRSQEEIYKAMKEAAKQPQASTAKLCGSVESGNRTTIMLRNIPNNHTRKMLLELLDSNDFALCYDFVYLPMDFKTDANLGYAFVNMISSSDANRAMQQLHGFSDWRCLASGKTCKMEWADPTQGLNANVQRFQNSPVMHHSVREDFKPLRFQQGVPMALPPPTRPVRAPRTKQ